MNRISILTELKECLLKHFDSFNFQILEDQLLIVKHANGFTFRTSIRCQNFGLLYLMNPQGISIKNENLENNFDSLVFNSLKKLNNEESTLVTTTTNLNINNVSRDFKIETENQIGNYCEIIKLWLNSIEKKFFEPMKDVKIIAKYISKYSYTDNLKVMVGGNFPVQTFKKMFILFIGGQMERYTEYKLGLEEQLKSLPLRKPEKSEDTKIYLENFYFLIKELETGKFILPTV